MPIGLQCDSAAIKATRLKLVAFIVRTRSEVRGSWSELGEVGGAVALTVALLSCFAALPEHAPLFFVPFRDASKSVGIWSGVMSVEKEKWLKSRGENPRSTLFTR